ncbi:MAG: DUF6198 family protein [Coriobacteriales bacterium]
MNRNTTCAVVWQRFFSRPTANLALRVVLMFAGLMGIALGISLAKLACMGTSPISSVPAVMTEVSEVHGIPLTMGMWTFVFNLSYFLLELALLRRAFRPVQFLQIPLFFVLSVFVDLWLAVFGPLAPQGYGWQLVWLLASIAVLGFGIRVQLAADLLMTPGDAAVQVIAYVSKLRFSRCKVIWDVSLMSIAALISLLVLGGLFQVREGTILSALLVGPMVRLVDRGFAHVSWLVPAASRNLVAPLCPDSDASPQPEAALADAVE